MRLLRPMRQRLPGRYRASMANRTFRGCMASPAWPALGRGARGARDAPPPPASPYANLPAQPTLKPGVQNRATPNSGRRNSRLPAASGRHGVWRAVSVPDLPEQELCDLHQRISGNVPHYSDRSTASGLMPRMIPRGWAIRSHAGTATRWSSTPLPTTASTSIGGIQEPSESFHTIERLTRTSATNIFYEIIYEDPEKADRSVESDAHVRWRYPCRREQGHGVRLRKQPRLYSAVWTAGSASSAGRRPRWTRRTGPRRPRRRRGATGTAAVTGGLFGRVSYQSYLSPVRSCA